MNLTEHRFGGALFFFVAERGQIYSVFGKKV